MLYDLWGILIYLFLFYPILVWGNCLNSKDLCAQNDECRKSLAFLEKFCDPLDCSETKCRNWRHIVQKTAGKNCFCDISSAQCQSFQRQIWHCESFGKRILRSPNSERIQRWKTELSEELSPQRGVLSSTSCNYALYDRCLKHISCRELWKLFRETCSVDEQNNCKMTNPHDCWQSFEGISWTGLGNCSCQTNNSDCHWIRLQTNYNKCIYEITSSGRIPSAVSVRLPVVEMPTTAVIPFWQQSSVLHPSTTHSPQTTSQIENYQRELARRENERREYEQRLRQYEERRRQWEEEQRRLTTISQQSSTTPSPISSTSVSSVSTSTAYIRATYSSTRNQPNESINSSTRNQSTSNRISSTTPQTTKAPGYRLRDRSHYRQTIQTSRPTIPTSTTTSTTPIPQTTTTTTVPTTSIIKTTSKPKTSTTTMRPMKARAGYSSGDRVTTTVPTSAESTTSSEEITTPLPPMQYILAEHKKSSQMETTESPQKKEEGSKEKEEEEEEEEESKETENLVNRWDFSLPESDERESSCPIAHEQCELDETCRWHLSELQMKCRSEGKCQRTQCAAAMRRFSRYVNKSILEAIMFCQCAFADISCKHQQQFMYPRCLYEYNEKKPKWSCSQTVKLCQHDTYCLRTLSALNSSCPLGNGGECEAADLHECRLALIGVRGTELESPCFCEKSDSQCLEYQNMVLPNNPCIENAMSEFNFTGNFPSPTEELKKIQKTGKRKKLKSNASKPKPTADSLKSSEEITTTTTADPSSYDIVIEMTPTDLINITETEERIITTTAPRGIRVSTRKGKTTAINEPKLVTQTPPPAEGGCSTRNIEGDWITHYKGSTFRQYNDLHGRCSSWCLCSENETFVCENLACLPEGSCITPQTTVAFGERLYVEGRGACLCQSGEFICDTNEDLVELDPGLYISLGFSRSELRLIKEKVPKGTLERSGLVSPETSVANDIASRLQFALERILPKDVLCRVALIERHSRESVILLQIQWYGLNWLTNETEPYWHIGKLEKKCAPFVRQLEYNFLMERADRYQLVLSTVKQIRVYDLLDGLPSTNDSSLPSLILCLNLTFVLSLFCLK